MTAPAHMSRRGVLFVASFEGLRLEPYTDPGGDATIGYGHRLHAGSVTKQDWERWRGFNKATALKLLASDVRDAEATVVTFVRPALLFPWRFDAVCDHVFNNGSFERSRTLLAALNSGRLRRGAADAFLLYDHDQHGDVLPGLEARCKARRRLFLYGVYP